MRRFNKIRKIIKKNGFWHQIKLPNNKMNKTETLSFKMVDSTKIWVYKNLNVVADIYINEKNRDKIYAEVDINPYSNINFQFIDKEFRSFLYDKWTRKQYNKLETIELFSKTYFDN